MKGSILCPIQALLICIVLETIASSSAQARDGLLNSSVEQVTLVLGKPVSHEKGNVSGMAYERYYFETEGWKTSVLFIKGKAQKLDTEKSDGLPLTAEEKKAVLDGYDLPATGQNSEIRGWRELSEGRLIRGDGRVRIIIRTNSMTIFLDDLPRDFL